MRRWKVQVLPRMVPGTRSTPPHESGEWYFALFGPNGKRVVRSVDDYKRRSTAIRAARRFVQAEVDVDDIEVKPSIWHTWGTDR